MKNTIERPTVTLDDWNKAVADLQAMVPTIREQAGPGAFICPHEVLGMMHGQQAKLSAEADKALYSDDPTEARKRMLKAAYGLIFGAASMDVVYSQAVRPSILDRLEADLRSIKDTAMECSAGNPPEGYDDLAETTAQHVADACWNNGLDAMETAIKNWIYDERNPVANKTDEPRGQS